jgi:hypothetical protein
MGTMSTIYQEELAEVAGESALYAPAMRRGAAYVNDLRRIITVAAGHDFHEAAARLQDDLADQFAGLRWHLVRRKRLMSRRCRPSARYRARLKWWESLTVLKLHGTLVRKLSVYEYRSLADAVRDVAIVSRLKGYSGIVGTDLPSGLAALLARDCYVRPSIIPSALASGQAAFFVMLMDDLRGIDLYWHRQSAEATAAAQNLAAASQTA